MSGGSALTSRVSAALRSAGLPVLRYGDRIDTRGHSGIRVGNGPFRGSTSVSILVWADDISHDRDLDAEREWSDKVLAVLIARGFNASRMPGASSIHVEAASGSSPAIVEDVQAVTAASGLEIVKLTHTEWHIAVNGQRAAYSIRRTGSGDRTRYAVHGRGYGNVLASKLWTMASAIETIKKDMDA